jgi:hypothetical protein
MKFQNYTVHMAVYCIFPSVLFIDQMNADLYLRINACRNKPHYNISRVFQIRNGRDSSVGTAIGLRTERSGRSGFESRWGLGIFLFATASRPALGPNQPHIQWVSGVKRPGRQYDHSQHLVQSLRMRGAIPPSTIYLHDVVLR